MILAFSAGKHLAITWRSCNSTINMKTAPASAVISNPNIVDPYEKWADKCPIIVKDSIGKSVKFLLSVPKTPSRCSKGINAELCGPFLARAKRPLFATIIPPQIPVARDIRPKYLT
jgi:hypothetical protein